MVRAVGNSERPANRNSASPIVSARPHAPTALECPWRSTTCGRHDFRTRFEVLDVCPDGRAHNLDESIRRMRPGDGYDKPPFSMEKDKVYNNDPG
jgi:hypothetical protein